MWMSGEGLAVARDDRGRFRVRCLDGPGCLEPFDLGIGASNDVVSTVLALAKPGANVVGERLGVRLGLGLERAAECAAPTVSRPPRPRCAPRWKERSKVRWLHECSWRVLEVGVEVDAAGEHEASSRGSSGRQLEGVKPAEPWSR